MVTEGTVAKGAKPGWSLRPAVLADQAGLTRLSAQLGYPIENQLLGHNLHFMLARPDHRVLVVADAHEQILGWVHGYVRVVLEAEPAVEVGGLVVDAACRGQGLEPVHDLFSPSFRAVPRTRRVGPEKGHVLRWTPWQ